jgi:hypothetical protein
MASCSTKTHVSGSSMADKGRSWTHSSAASAQTGFVDGQYADDVLQAPWGLGGPEDLVDLEGPW